jgi:energy-coupling factor transporter ATP-binding protein EcfA2
MSQPDPLHAQPVFSGDLALRFVPLEVVHHGSRSRVVRAQSREGDERVVVKLPAGATPAASHASRVQWEFSVLRALRGVPGVVEVIDLVPLGSTFALLLRGAPGKPVHRARLLASGGLRAALLLAVQLSATLSRVHAAGIIHCDVKPQNLLWDAESRTLTLVDFETARYVTTGARGGEAAPPGRSWGTPAYMAPEQSERTSYPVDERADLYAAGATLYELLSGRPPFVDGNPGELIHRHIGDTPERLRDVAPAVPPVLSEIVMTLLQKDPAQRYQTAAGLASDLGRCLDAVTAEGDVRPFRLRCRDYPNRLTEVTHPVGRQHELDTLEQAAFRARQGARELVLVWGDSGMGKSTLLGALRGALSNTSTLVLEGKFEQFARATPYLAFRQILRALGQAILSESNEGVLGWKEELERALGSNVSLVTEVCPELALLFDSPPRAARTGPSEAAHRFKHTMRQFWRTIATEQHPVVLLIDDLQWGDVASWQLIQTLLSASELTHLLVVGAYRTDDLAAELPLHLLRDLWGEVPDPCPAVRLGALGASETACLVRKALDTTQGNLAELASVLGEKSAGNPFFLIQLLRDAHRQGWLARDVLTGEWRWTIDALRSMRSAPSVAPLLAARLSTLSDALRGLLRIASCLGHDFDERALALAAALPRDEVSQALERLAEMGLIARDVAPGVWLFTHDKIQQAAYQSADIAATKQLHLSIARLLDTDPCYADAALEQWNHAADRLTDGAMQRRLARRNLEAAAAAERSLALEAALGYVENALALLAGSDELPGEPVRDEAELLRAELLFRLGDAEAAEGLFAGLLAGASSPERRARLLLHLSRLRGSLGDFALSYATALDGLLQLGVAPPDELPPGGEGMLDGLFPSGNSGDLGPAAEQAPLEDHELELELMLVAWLSCLYSQRSALTEWWSYQLGLGSARNPRWRGRGVALASIGLMLSGHETTAARAFCLATAGYAYDRRAACLPQAALVYAPVAYFIEGEATAHAMMLDAIRQAIAQGDMTAAMLASIMPLVFTATRSPSRTLEALRVALPELREGPSVQIARLLEPLDQAPTMAQAVDYLGSMVRLQASSSSEALAAACVLVPYAICCGGEESLSVLSSYISSYQPRVLLVTLTELWISSFLLTRQLERAPAPELLQRLEELTERLAFWVDLLHSSYAARLLLLRAEHARWSGRPGDAMRLYEESISSALSSGHAFDLAICLERAAEFYLASGSARAARQFLIDAIRAYESWGFPAKVAELFERHASALGASPAGLASPSASSRPPSARPPASDDDVTTTITSPLPARSALAACAERASPCPLMALLSKDTADTDMAEQILRALLAAAESHKVVLVAGRGCAWRVRAALSTWSEPRWLDVDEPVDESRHVTPGLVRLALRSAQPLALAGAPQGRAAAARAPAHPCPLAQLFLQITHMNDPVGLLVFEHFTSPGHFDPPRVERLARVVSQTSAALESIARLLSPRAAGSA